MTGNGLIATGTLRVIGAGDDATVMIGADALSELLRRRYAKAGQHRLIRVEGVRVSIEQYED